MRRIIARIVLALFFPAWVQVQAQAQIQNGDGATDNHAHPVSYLLDSRNKVVHSGSGLCWRTGHWTPALAETAMAGWFPLSSTCNADVVSEGIYSGRKGR